MPWTTKSTTPYTPTVSYRPVNASVGLLRTCVCGCGVAGGASYRQLGHLKMATDCVSKRASNQMLLLKVDVEKISGYVRRLYGKLTAYESEQKQ
jgi:hypothetical protein